MSYATQLALILTTLPSAEEELRHIVQEAWNDHRQQLEHIVLSFVTSEISPRSTHELEHRIQEEVRQLARQLLERIFNNLEPETPEEAPHDVTYQAGGYRRLNRKTRNAYVSTLFGNIELYRYPYRHWHRDAGESVIFPLELQLGLVHGATPALAEAAAHYLAEGGATQRIVLDRLKSQHGVSWGAERLRDAARDVSLAMEQFRQEFQVLRILELLEKADQSRGSRKPVLSVGRDGITLREYRYRFFQVATSATVTVYDRAGNRLGTVYLAFAPELGQTQMSEQLTALVREILRRWEGRLPRLCYVTDAGENETKYYRTVLRNMRHPRTGERLQWRRIVDYYHTTKRIGTMAEALFTKRKKQESATWARRMCRLLLKPNGPYRVLHSAAALRAKQELSPPRADEFRKAYNYIRNRTAFMQYHEYRRLQLPIGSGVTEAACKTIFTQRLKLSGMRWGNAGAQVILNLRVSLLSGIWTPLYRRVLDSYNENLPRIYGPSPELELKNAA